MSHVTPLVISNTDMALGLIGMAMENAPALTLGVAGVGVPLVAGVAYSGVSHVYHAIADAVPPLPSSVTPKRTREDALRGALRERMSAKKKPRVRVPAVVQRVRPDHIYPGVIQFGGHSTIKRKKKTNKKKKYRWPK